MTDQNEMNKELEDSNLNLKEFEKAESEIRDLILDYDTIEKSFSVDNTEMIREPQKKATLIEDLLEEIEDARDFRHIQEHHEQILLIWLDKNIFDSPLYPSNTFFLEQLRQNYSEHVKVLTYERIEGFLEFLLKDYKQEPIIFLISGEYSPHIPSFYGKCRLKSINIYTSPHSLQEFQNTYDEMVKEFPKITKVTANGAIAREMVHREVHNTLFKGACKFQELDFYFGKIIPIKLLFINSIHDEAKPFLAPEEKQKQLTEDVEISSENEHVFVFTANPKDVLKLFLLEFKNLNAEENDSNAEDYYQKLLQEAFSIVVKRRITIRREILELPKIISMSESFAECFKDLDSSQEESISILATRLLQLYTKNELPFYDIVNCCLNTLNEELIDVLSCMIGSLRAAHLIYNDDFDFKEFEAEENSSLDNNIQEQNQSSKKNIFTIYRGCKFDREYFSKFFHSGDEIVFPAFTSTTTDLSLAKQYATSLTDKRIIFKIECDLSNEQVANRRPKSLENISHHPEEREFLLNCLSLHRIVNIVEDFEGFLLYELVMVQ